MDRLISNNIALAPILLCFLAIKSCTFTADDENFQPIPPPESAHVSYELNAPYFSDPFYLFETVKFTFTIHDITTPNLGYDLLFDNEIYTSFQSRDEVFFYLSPDQFEYEGSYEITLRVKIATGTGSIAETLGAEYYVVEKTFTVIIDTTPPELTKEPTLSYVNGYLQLDWGAPSHKNFFYTIKRTYYNSVSYSPGDITIYDLSQASFIDSGYVGGEMHYKIMANGFGFSNHPLGSIAIHDEPISYQIIYNENNLIGVQRKEMKINSFNTSATLYTINGIFSLPFDAGQLVIDTLSFAEHQDYLLNISKENYPNQTFQKILRAEISPNLKKYNGFAMLPNHNKLLISTDSAIYRYDLISLEIEDSLTAVQAGVAKFKSLTANELENLAVTVVDENKLLLINPLFLNDFSVREVVDNMQIYGNTEVNSIDLGNLSNDLVAMVVYKYGRKWGVVFDLSTDQFVWHSNSFQNLNKIKPPTLSNNGSYLAYDLPATDYGEVYTLTDGSFEKTGRVKIGNKYFRGNELISTTDLEWYPHVINHKINVYDLQMPPTLTEDEFTLIRELDVPENRGVGYLEEVKYDPINEVAYLRYFENSSSVLYLLDIEDFSEIGSVRASTSTKNSHDLSNDYHFTNKGYIKNIN